MVDRLESYFCRQKVIEKNSLISFLANSNEIRSNTSVCLKVNLVPEKIKEMVKILDKEGAAFDCGSYKDAPAGLRFWCGPTVEKSDIEKVLPWLEWAYEQVK